jgi:hypothetical protein
VPSGPTGRAVTAQGHPRSNFKRAIERGNVVVAEATARELGQLSLEEALELVLLYAAYEPAKVERAALRCFARYLDKARPFHCSRHTSRCRRWSSFEPEGVSRRRSC